MYADFNIKAVELFKLIIKYAKEKNTSNPESILVNKIFVLDYKKRAKSNEVLKVS